MSRNLPQSEALSQKVLYCRVSPAEAVEFKRLFVETGATMHSFVLDALREKRHQIIEANPVLKSRLVKGKRK